MGAIRTAASAAIVAGSAVDKPDLENVFGVVEDQLAASLADLAPMPHLIADNGVYSVATSTLTDNEGSAFVAILAAGKAISAILFISASEIAEVFTGANFDTSTSVLTGTTGVDGSVTASVNSGTFYLENRAGGSADFAIKPWLKL